MLCGEIPHCIVLIIDCVLSGCVYIYIVSDDDDDDDDELFTCISQN